VKRLTGTVALAGFAGMAIAATGCEMDAGIATQHENRGYEVPVGQLHRLDLRIDSADVEITGTATNKILVHERLKFTRKNKPTPEHKTTGDTLELGYRCPDGLRVGISVCDVGYRVEVPAQFAVKVTNDSGTVAVRGVRGGLQAKIDSGALEAHDLGGGAVNADIDSGRLEVTGAGDLTVKIDSGHLVATELTGKRTTVDADSGTVRLRFAAGSPPDSVTTTVASGTTRIWLPAVAGGYRIEDRVTSGNRRVDSALRGDSARIIRATADSGNIHVMPR
jgi:putative adhesin